MKQLSFLVLLSALLLTSCGENEIEITDGEITAEVYFTGLVDGQTVTFEATALGEYQAGISQGGSLGTDNCTIDYGGFIGDFENTEGFSADFFSFYNGPCAEETDVFHDLFPVGTDYDYLMNNAGSAKGVEIQYWTNSTFYRSGNGPQDASSSFEVLESTPIESAFGKYQRIKGQFNCTVYTEGGESLTIENAEFVVDVESYF